MVSAYAAKNSSYNNGSQQYRTRNSASGVKVDEAELLPAKSTHSSCGNANDSAGVNTEVLLKAIRTVLFPADFPGNSILAGRSVGVEDGDNGESAHWLWQGSQPAAEVSTVHQASRKGTLAGYGESSIGQLPDSEGMHAANHATPQPMKRATSQPTGGKRIAMSLSGTDRRNSLQYSEAVRGREHGSCVY